MPNGDAVKPAIPGTPQNWLQGVIAIVVMGAMGAGGINLKGITDNQKDSEQAVTTVIEKLEEINGDADKMRRDFQKQLKAASEKQDEILTILKRLEASP